MEFERREILKSMAISFAVFSICRNSLAQQLIAPNIYPLIVRWLNQVEDLAHAVKERRISQLEWKSMMGSLYDRVPLADLMRFIDFDTLVRNQVLAEKGETFDGLNLPKVEGFDRHTFYNFFSGFRKGTSIPPHGHNHQVSSFLVLKGKLHGRDFDRVRDENDGLVIRPSIDQVFETGQYSSISQHKDNVHWFTALEDNCYIIDFGVGGLKPSGTVVPFPNQSPNRAGRIFLDIDAGLDGRHIFHAKRISETDAYQKYG